MPSIEYVTVANHAEAINGLLYLQGAGWSEIRIARQPNGQLGPAHFGIGVSILVGWTETNQRFPFEIQVLHKDGGEPLLQAQGQVEQGRPPGLAHGSDLRSTLAINVETLFPRPGGYEVRAAVGSNTRSVSFRVGMSPVAPFGPGSIAMPMPPK
jgi:hypothetical protein